ncbi:MAG: endo-1,4-beta-xylanase [Planctomycetota bacterium]
MSRLLAALLLTLAAAPTVAEPSDSLATAYENHFKLGVALPTSSLMRPEADVLALAASQFNSATPENCMKWQPIQPRPGEYDFSAADRFVDFCEQRDWWIVGHTLIWHQQTPEWVFQNDKGEPLTRDDAIERMRDHIRTVVGRYRGRVHAWDVVNEALNEDGSLRETKWLEIIGDDYLDLAFRFAQEADADAELYYNDYNLYVEDKAKGAVRLVRKLRRAGRRVDAIGIQGHWAYNHPPLKQASAAIRRLAKATGRLMITELDVNILPWPGDNIDADVARRAVGSPDLDPYTAGLPPEKQQELADRYAELFRLFIRHRDKIDRVTFWGVHDGGSWHNHWPIEGRTAHSLLFDRRLQSKPAFDAVTAVGRER